MKQQLFVILGYGVPKDIRLDVNNQLLLRTAFNSAYQSVIETGSEVLLVSTGGPTDMFKPYRRTEGGVMTTELRRMSMILPPHVRRHVKFAAENKSLSMLENFLLTRPWIKKYQSVTVFCEVTRVARVRRVARLVWGKRIDVRVRGVDFDASANRYLDPTFLAKKEATAWRFDRWAMKSLANRRRHHAVYQEKVYRFRALGPSGHVDAIRAWFEETMKTFPAEVRGE